MSTPEGSSAIRKQASKRQAVVVSAAKHAKAYAFVPDAKTFLCLLDYKLMIEIYNQSPKIRSGRQPYSSRQAET